MSSIIFEKALSIANTSRAMIIEEIRTITELS
jgi:hypothetical protein